jgi:hypothetical protein
MSARPKVIAALLGHSDSATTGRYTSPRMRPRPWSRLGGCGLGRGAWPVSGAGLVAVAVVAEDLAA